MRGGTHRLTPARRRGQRDWAPADPESGRPRAARPTRAASRLPAGSEPAAPRAGRRSSNPRASQDSGPGEVALLQERSAFELVFADFTVALDLLDDLAEQVRRRPVAVAVPESDREEEEQLPVGSHRRMREKGALELLDAVLDIRERALFLGVRRRGEHD